MDAERWRRVEDIFHAAIEKAEAERETYVQQACAGDEELLSEVHAWLKNDVGEGHLLDEAVQQAASNYLDDDPNIGRRVGAYRLLRLIGKGGMGAVYLAERADGEFQQLAAIKLVKRGMDTDFILGRFRQERQILAGLNHPYVTRLLDGGSTADGLPYFVMEYVEGRSIYAYCAEKQLSIHDRLRLFCKVCEAVAYAHGQRVVHRDLKPTNILVTAEETPRLMDFGIAKIVDPTAVPDTAQQTGAHLRLMTPEYASPEQVQGLPIGVGTDIYALGVMLFELLTGRRPYELGSRTVTEAARVICEVDPTRPSQAVAEARLPLSGSGSSDLGVEEWSKQLRGDLDKVVLHALEKHPSARYLTVEELQHDVTRFLDGMAVTAKGRSAKPWSRRKLLLGAGAAVAVGFIALGVQWWRTSETVTPGSIAILPLVNLSGDPATLTFARTLREELVTELADSGWRVVTHGGELEMEGSVRSEAETKRVTMRMVKRADRSVTWAKAFDGPREREVAQMIAGAVNRRRQSASVNEEATGLLVEGYSFLRRDPRKESQKEARERVAKSIATFEKAVQGAPQFAPAWAGLASAQWQMADQHDHPQFEEWMRKAEATARQALALDSTLDEAYTTLGAALYFGRHDFQGALNAFARSVEFNPRRATPQRLLADLLCLYGRFDEALAEIERAQALEPQDSDLIAHQGLVYLWKRRPKEAEHVGRRAIASQPDHWYGHWVLGMALQQEGNFDEAEKELNASSQSNNSGFRPLIALGHLYGATGQREKALQVVKSLRSQSEGVLRKYIYPEALILAGMGEKDKAFALLNKAYEIGDLNLPYTKLDPRMDTLRGDPRYGALLKKLGLPE